MDGQTEGRRLPAAADLRLPGARTPRRGPGGFAGTAELERVGDLPRLPGVPQALRQRLRQPEALIDPLEQHRAPIGAAVLLVQLGHHRLASEMRKQNTPSGKIVIHEEALVVRNGCDNTFLTQLGPSLIQGPDPS
jgi:hypothetical protein